MKEFVFFFEDVWVEKNIFYKCNKFNLIIIRGCMGFILEIFVLVGRLFKMNELFKEFLINLVYEYDDKLILLEFF